MKKLKVFSEIKKRNGTLGTIITIPLELHHYVSCLNWNVLMPWHDFLGSILGRWWRFNGKWLLQNVGWIQCKLPCIIQIRIRCHIELNSRRPPKMIVSHLHYRQSHLHEFHSKIKVGLTTLISKWNSQAKHTSKLETLKELWLDRLILFWT